MQCPTCNYANTATSVRCIQCSTVLIPEAMGRSKEYVKAAGELDSRMFSGIGSLVGFFLVATLLKFVLIDVRMTDREIYGAAIGGAMVGAILVGLYCGQNRRACDRLMHEAFVTLGLGGHRYPAGNALNRLAAASVNKRK